MKRALIIRKPWIDMILRGEKVWEMRSTPTRICERIGLIEQGTGMIVGECYLAGSLSPLETEHSAIMSQHLHRVQDLSLIKKWKYPWQMCDVKKYENPKPYKHPKGAVIWVKLETTNE